MFSHIVVYLSLAIILGVAVALCVYVWRDSREDRTAQTPDDQSGPDGLVPPV